MSEISILLCAHVVGARSYGMTKIEKWIQRISGNASFSVIENYRNVCTLTTHDRIRTFIKYVAQIKINCAIDGEV